MPAGAKILLIEDERCTRLLLRHGLMSGGFDVVEAIDGGEGLQLIAKERPSAVVLDVGLPGIGGWEVLARLRATGHRVPVLILTSNSSMEDRLRGFGAGADDYLAKPFDHREVTARVRALLRRGGRPDHARAATGEFCVGGTTINLFEKTARNGGGPVALTKKEYAILECLLQSGNRPTAREQLLRVVWGYENVGATRTVETHIWRLRRKLGDMGDGPTGIFNKTGLGYFLVVGKAKAVRSLEGRTLATI